MHIQCYAVDIQHRKMRSLYRKRERADGLDFLGLLKGDCPRARQLAPEPGTVWLWGFVKLAGASELWATSQKTATCK